MKGAESISKQHLQNVANNKSGRHLVVDDNVTNNRILKGYLESSSQVLVDVAISGEAALELVCKNGTDYYDVIWTDLKMDGIGGTELAKRLRNLGFGKFVAVLTGNITEQGQRDCQEAGVDIICLKPIRKAHLLSLQVMKLYQTK